VSWLLLDLVDGIGGGGRSTGSARGERAVAWAEGGAPEKSFRHPTHRRCRCRSFLVPGVVDHSRLASHHRPTAHATFVSTTIETAPPGLSSPDLVVDPSAPCALSTTLQTRCGQGFLATAGVEDETVANHPRDRRARAARRRTSKPAAPIHSAVDARLVAGGQTGAHRPKKISGR